MNIYSELFQTRQQIFSISRLLERLSKHCNRKCSNEIRKKVKMLEESLEHLELKSHILEKLTKNYVFL